MKELCVDARLITSSGIGTYLKNLLPRLAQCFNLRLIVSPSAPKKIAWLSSYELIFSAAPLYSVQEVLALPFAIPRCDVFWSPHYNVPLLPIRAGKRVVTIHDAYHLAFFSSLTLPQKLYAKALFPAAIKYSDLVVTDSWFSHGEILKYTRVKKDRLHVAYLGVDREIFHEHVDAAKRHTLRLPEKFALFVGNVKPHKNVRGLIAAAKHIGCPLVVVGQRKGLITQENLPEESALFLENVEDAELPHLYRLAAVTVLPSFYEGFGLPALEAMSCGCPVIVSHLPSLREVCGDAALYVDPHSPQNMADTLALVWGDPMLQGTLRKKGIEKSLTFCWNECAQKHIEWFS